MTAPRGGATLRAPKSVTPFDRIHAGPAARRQIILFAPCAPLRENENMSAVAEKLPDAQGHFGPYGGRYVPETLMHPLQELEAEYFRAQHDPEFQRELSYYLTEFVGRPTPLYFAERLTKELGGAKIYLKREDLNHTGAHKINNAMGQILLAKRMGKTRIIAET